MKFFLGVLLAHVLVVVILSLSPPKTLVLLSRPSSRSRGRQKTDSTRPESAMHTVYLPTAALARNLLVHSTVIPA